MPEELRYLRSPTRRLLFFLSEHPFNPDWIASAVALATILAFCLLAGLLRRLEFTVLAIFSPVMGLVLGMITYSLVTAVNTIVWRKVQV